MGAKQNTWYNQIFAAAYDPFMESAETNALAQRRRELLEGLSGKILEIGCGTGVNFSYYESGADVLALEPAEAMRVRAESRLQTHDHRAKIRIEGWYLGDPAFGAEFPDGTFDAVVCTLVLCTVPEPAAILNSLRRLIKPKGKLIALEHVKATSIPGQLLQDFMNPVWKHIAEGCHLNRDTHAAMLNAGFGVITKEEFSYGLPFVSAIYSRGT
jgi:SAM-dependent methyltransferase